MAINIENLSNKLKNELMKMGASMVGFADLSELPEEVRNGKRYAISIVLAENPIIINGIANGPTKEFYEEYVRMHNLLDEMDIRASEIIKSYGFDAIARVRGSYEIDNTTNSTMLPHKTVATRAGIGWIGKCAALVTEKYGAAVKISTVLTDAPLEVGKPINISKCGSCDVCVKSCPAGAVSGKLWRVGVYRDEFFDAQKCSDATYERTFNIAPGEQLCGLCMLVCPWTKRYIEDSGIEYSIK